MEFRNPQFRESLHSIAMQMKLAPVTDERKEVADELIGKNTDRVTEELTRIRTYVDEFFKKRGPELATPETKRLFQKYPIGCCMFIREAVMEVIQSLASAEQYIPKTQRSILTQIVETLGVKRVWGIQDDQYFQNGIQAENYFLDSANDTVDITQPKVIVSTIEQAKFRDIRSLQDYLDIENRYHQLIFERNTAIPELAPLFPLIEIENGKGMQRKTIHSIPRPVMADAILRSGLGEFKKAYSEHPKTDEETEEKIAEIVDVMRYNFGFPQTNPYPSPGLGLSICRSFSTASRALSSPEIDPKILSRLYKIVEEINKVSINVTLIKI